MKRCATVNEILSILKDHSLEFSQQLAISPLQLSLPTDGRGVRIKVSVQRGQKSKLPLTINFTLNGNEVSVPLEVEEDYQVYELR